MVLVTLVIGLSLSYTLDRPFHPLATTCGSCS